MLNGQKSAPLKDVLLDIQHFIEVQKKEFVIVRFQEAKKVKAESKKKAKEDFPPAKDDDSDEDDDDDSDEEEEEESKKEEVEIQLPKTKAAAMNNFSEKLAKLRKADIMANYETIMKSLDLNEETDENVVDTKPIDVNDDVEALVEGEDLSEEFTAKATTIFEAAVKSKLRSEVERLDMEKTQEVAEEVETLKNELTEKVDSYLDYVVKEWMQENELAIDRGLKGEIAEDFITGLKALFEEHYIDVPDEKYDILEGQAQKIEELESKLNETIEKMTTMNKEKSTLVREQVIAKVSTDLAETEKEKFEGLVEDVEFTSEDDFTAKLNTLKENYFPKSVATQTLEEEVETENQEVDVSGAMAAYMSAIQKSKPYGAEAFNIVKK